jgi:hypothetical protein
MTADLIDVKCPKCDGYIHENKCIICNTTFTNYKLHKIWLKKFNEIYNIEEEEDKE